ncbi:MAG TPA: hypothetical protein VLJ59_13605 [Mycobacteriales bacterium]|nr:hypothetical protein [Mycobacteriales bacterium]
MPTTTSPQDLVSTWTDAWRQWWADSRAAFDPYLAAWSGTAGRPYPAAGATGSDCGCGRRGSHGCQEHPEHHCRSTCTACTPDADVVVRLHAGERRLVPVLVRNVRHREREVTVEVGPWTSCDGPPVQVVADLDVDGPFTLAPCQDRLVRIGLTVGVPANGTREPGQAGGPDLDAAASAYADVRFEGCSRPLRVAVVVTPAACEAVEVSCGCDCCC